MPRRGHSTAIGKFAKIHHDRRVSEIRMLGALLRREQSAAPARLLAHLGLPARPDAQDHHD